MLNLVYYSTKSEVWGTQCKLYSPVIVCEPLHSQTHYIIVVHFSSIIVMFANKFHILSLTSILEQALKFRIKNSDTLKAKKG